VRTENTKVTVKIFFWFLLVFPWFCFSLDILKVQGTTVSLKRFLSRLWSKRVDDKFVNTNHKF